MQTHCQQAEEHCVRIGGWSELDQDGMSRHDHVLCFHSKRHHAQVLRFVYSSHPGGIDKFLSRFSNVLSQPFLYLKTAGKYVNNPRDF